MTFQEIVEREKPLWDVVTFHLTFYAWVATTVFVTNAVLVRLQTVKSPMLASFVTWMLYSVVGFMALVTAVLLVRLFILSRSMRKEFLARDHRSVWSVMLSFGVIVGTFLSTGIPLLIAIAVIPPYKLL